ncbi:MAG: zf-HC2 domain-containing protein [Candidatus Aminicenantales bacterium]
MKKDLPAFLCGELEAADEKRLREHLQECPACTKELEEIKTILEGAESFQGRVSRVMATINWDGLSRQITDAVFQKKMPLSRDSKISRFWKSLFLPKWKPVYAGVVAGLVIGSLATLWLLKPDIFIRSKGERIFASKDFIEKVEFQLARRETLDYLERSQYLILDFIQSSSDEVPSGQNIFASQEARDLLSRKKYITQQLNRFEMAKAKEICDQIEILFLELSRISEELTAEEIARIQSLVQKKQLLLKIKLMKKELEEREEV